MSKIHLYRPVPDIYQYFTFCLPASQLLRDVEITTAPSALVPKIIFKKSQCYTRFLLHIIRTPATVTPPPLAIRGPLPLFKSLILSVTEKFRSTLKKNLLSEMWGLFKCDMHQFSLLGWLLWSLFCLVNHAWIPYCSHVLWYTINMCLVLWKSLSQY